MGSVYQPLNKALQLNQEILNVFWGRSTAIGQRFFDSIHTAQTAMHAAALPLTQGVTQPQEIFSAACDYMLDSAQRSVLFWDTLYQRGNQFVEREADGLPSVLRFEYDLIMDARTFEKPVNYALARIKPSNGEVIDNASRPYLIIDPRAGHGPGIGGFKYDSQVGVALRSGHPVYFVLFFRDPEQGQTLLDVCEVEAQFVKRIVELHPLSPRPAILGNCQGGWAAMMLAATTPELSGPVVINGAPMSYWGGAWEEGDGDNPMRYAGGLLGGTWLSSFIADSANGIFDGAWLVQNFENLHPSNTFWSKYYHLYENIDTEAPRFLEFERWWGGFYLMNREEIEWITQNLFVGNKLWTGDTKSQSGQILDLRQIRTPIILFASMGDNITPPEQAFNWVGDVYKSTEEIKTNGQVIVGLLHQSIGHLGIFVSGQVAKKEHAQIVSVMESIEALPPGLYAMQINERKSPKGEIVYEVEFFERQLEEVLSRLNTYNREDEKVFTAVADISEFNQRAYELFARPFVQAAASDELADLMRTWHPLRAQRWLLSEKNPLLSGLPYIAEEVRKARYPVSEESLFRQLEKINSSLIVATMDASRDLRDTLSESLFFFTFGNAYIQQHANDPVKKIQEAVVVDPRQQQLVKQALANIANGGYVEALARIGALLKDHDQALPLSRLNLRKELIDDYHSFLVPLPVHELRQIRGIQETIVKYEPQKALTTLPALLNEVEARRILQLLSKLTADPRVRWQAASPQQHQTLQKIRDLLLASISGIEADDISIMAPALDSAGKKSLRNQSADQGDDY